MDLNRQISVSSENPSIGYLNLQKSGRPITVIGTKKIRSGLEEQCLQQAVNARNAPGVDNLIINPDAHAGWGAPVGCVMTSPNIIYPGPVGVDMKCSMSLLQLELPKEELKDKAIRRELINAILERVPIGAGKGQKNIKQTYDVSPYIGESILCMGAADSILSALGIPHSWKSRCEDFSHGEVHKLRSRLSEILNQGVLRDPEEKFMQLGSVGGGNHFIEIGHVQTNKFLINTANGFNLKDNNICVLSHFGSRGIGSLLANNQFNILQEHFEKWNIPFPADDPQLVYAPENSPEGQNYLNDMYLAGNFATMNHLFINKRILDAFQQIFPGIKGELVYYISHNMARKEIINNKETWVFRKGATRAYPAGHFSLKGTEFYDTGHPILLPGNCVDGSLVMAARPGAEKTCYSINHGAGRPMSRTKAKATFTQEEVDKTLEDRDILINCRNVPIDESQGAYKDFREVTTSVTEAGLADTVAWLRPLAVIKAEDKPRRKKKKNG